MKIQKFQENVAIVRERIRAAEVRSGRKPGSVQLVGVSKYADVATTTQLVAAGCTVLGENRPQSMWEKAMALNDPQIAWHLIGHLQRNKVKRTVEMATLIQSADSARLLDAINDAGAEINRPVPVLLEVNISSEASKHGFAPSELNSTIERVSRLRFVHVNGLMAMAGLAGDAADARREFAALRELMETQRSNLPDNVRLDELSMGMSGDFEIAIEEGATIVRVGSLLFNGLR